MGGMPIILYNVPPMAGGVAFTVPLIRDLAEIPNIIGIKDTSGNIVQLTEIVQKVKVHSLKECSCAIGFCPVHVESD